MKQPLIDSAEVSRTPSWRPPLPLWVARALLFLVRARAFQFCRWYFAGAPPSLVVSVRLFGRSFDLSPHRSSLHGSLIIEGERAIQEAALLRRLVGPGMRIADVGANIGYLLLLFSDLLESTGSIEAFEPEASNLEELDRLLATHPDLPVRLHRCAVGARRATVLLEPGLNGRVVGSSATGSGVTCDSLDNLVGSPLDFVKIDVEGYETEVLCGARRHLLGTSTSLFLEVHPQWIADPEAFEREIEALEEAGRQFQAYAPAQTGSGARRVARRYFGEPVRRARELENPLRVVVAAGRTAPYWLVSQIARKD